MTGLIRFFETMEDPRVERTKHHKFIDIISITIAAVICGCEDWNEKRVVWQAQEGMAKYVS